MIKITLLDIIPIILSIYVICKCKITDFYDNILPLQKSNFLKGLFSLLVIMHHLPKEIQQDGLLLHNLANHGYLFVSVFFFLSAYGIHKSKINKENYEKSFISKRIKRILIPYIIFTLIYLVFKNVTGENCSLMDTIKGFFNGEPIVTFSWYIICLLVYCVFYYFAIKLFKRNEYIIACVSLFYFLFSIFCYLMDYGSWWYKSCHLFIIGLLFATYENKIITFFKKYYLVSLFAICIVFVLLSKYIPMSNKVVILQMIQSVLFVILIYMTCMKVKVTNNLLTYLGNYSLEIYLSQGLFINLFRSDLVYIENNILYCIIVLTITIVYSILHKNIYEYIIR